MGTEDKSSFSKKGRHNLPGHFTGHHVRKLLSKIKGHDEADEAPSEAAKRHEQARHAAEASTKFPSRDDVATGEGISEAMSLDAIRNWKRP